jgi:MraZ protein
MPGPSQFLLGEFRRTLDERYRLSLPSELGDVLAAESTDCILAKERPGCLSLWSAPVWQSKFRPPDIAP